MLHTTTTLRSPAGSYESTRRIGPAATDQRRSTSTTGAVQQLQLVLVLTLVLVLGCLRSKPRATEQDQELASTS
jgi:hypothetical protein